MSRGVRPVLSSAFESGVGLSVIGHLAATLDDVLREEVAAAKEFLVANDDTERPRAMDVKPLILELDDEPTAHGLGTATWFDDDALTPNVAPVRATRDGGARMDLRVAAAASETTSRVSPFTDASSSRWGETVVISATTATGTYDVKCVDTGAGDEDVETFILLHGFMGSSADWNAVARGLVAHGGARVIALDLPAHGGTILASSDASSEKAYGIEAMRDVVESVVRELGCRPEKTHVVGYSMGARVALALDETIAKGFIAIGGSPGVRGDDARRTRATRDDDLADALRRADGVREFSEVWYRQGLFSTLVAHPRFGGVTGLAERRGTGADANALAACVSAASPGRQIDGWPALDRFRGKLALIVGEEDAKFKSLATKMRDAVATRESSLEEACDIVVVPRCGHAVHLEAPEVLVRVVLGLAFAEPDVSP